MQVKIKLGNYWWLLPSNPELTEEELHLFRDVPFIAKLQAGEMVRVLDVQKKKNAKMILAKIASAYIQGFKPDLQGSSIIFVELGS